MLLESLVLDWSGISVVLGDISLLSSFLHFYSLFYLWLDLFDWDCIDFEGLNESILTCIALQNDLESQVKSPFNVF